MTHTEEVSTSFESKTPTAQINGHSMAASESREPEEQGSNTTSPSEGRHADGTSGSSVLEMGSTDSAGNAHGGGSSCGLVSSLFPSSCRGRAEAFARRLHHRLTSLGGEDRSSGRDVDPTIPKETTWLHAPTAKTVNNTNHVLQRQPRHNSETDLYYDFDIDLEDDPGSPAEEASADELADLLVNPGLPKNSRDENGCRCSPGAEKPITRQDSESGCVFASPITGTSPDSDCSEIYFDPESSEPEKGKGEFFFDPVTTSDSEATSTFSNGCARKARSIPCRRRPENHHFEPVDDTSESSSSTRRSYDKEQQREDSTNSGSSEESTNGRSSLETTSLSHESLWSTFDESTMSLQDESPPKTEPGLLAPTNRLSKSYSDSEIPVNGVRVTSSESDRRDDGLGDVDEVDFVANGSLENGKLEDPTEISLKDEKKDSTENLVKDLPTEMEEQPMELIVPTKNVLNLKVDDTVNSDAENDHSTYSSMINIPGALTLECSTGVRVIETTLKNEVKLQIENGTITNTSDEDKMCLLLKKLATSPTIKEEIPIPVPDTQKTIVNEVDVEEEEEEEERPQKIRRCSSLKTGKTPPGTPGRKKIVRFADVLGLDLADVRTFLDEIPKIPNSAYSDLIYDDIFQKDSSPVNSQPNTWGARYLDSSRRGSDCPLSRKLDRTLVPLFQQPGGLPNFLDLIRERRVCLENVLVQDPVTLCIKGTVRVLNLDFHKSVHIRYTLNSWRNFSDLQATYVSNSCDGFSDKFSFVLYCHTLAVGQKLEFAVRFQCKGTQYWDNNDGANYCFQCLPTSSAVGYIPITAPENQQRDWSPVFY